MKLQVALVLSAFATTASHVSAESCTPNETAVINGTDPDGVAIKAACPVLYFNGSEVLHPTAASTVDALKEIEPCKETTCTAYLTELTDSTPSCELEGVNVKGLYGTVLKLCTKLASGPISDADLEDIFEDLVKNAGKLLEAGSGSEETVAGESPTTDATTEPPSESTPAPSSNDSASKASTIAPAATTSSAVPFFTGVAAVAAAAIASALVL